MTPPAQEKHLMRCERCDFYDLRDTVQMGEWISVGTCGGKIISDSDVRCIAEHGCASHSDIRQHPYPQTHKSENLIMPNAFDLKRGLACWGYYYRDDMVSPVCIRDCEFKQSCIIVSKMLSNKNITVQCPHWECIEHSDGMEWCCNRESTEKKIADVIKELNRREHDLGMHHSEKDSGKIEGYNEAISLLWESKP